jgi:hypothetical protein
MQIPSFSRGKRKGMHEKNFPYSLFVLLYTHYYYNYYYFPCMGYDILLLLLCIIIILFFIIIIIIYESSIDFSLLLGFCIFLQGPVVTSGELSTKNCTFVTEVTLFRICKSLPLLFRLTDLENISEFAIHGHSLLRR